LVGGRIYDSENGKTCHQVSTCRRHLLHSGSASALCAVGHFFGAGFGRSLLLLLPARSAVRKQRTFRWLASSRGRRGFVHSTSATSAYSTGKGICSHFFLSFTGSLSISVVEQADIVESHGLI
jgi:hypothetical protein